MLLVDLLRQRQLHEDAVDRWVGVEPVDQRQQIGLAGVGGQAVLEALHPGLDRRLALVADIDLARRILADQHDRQARARGRSRRGSAATAPRQPLAQRRRRAALPSISLALIRRNNIG